jgi:ribonuclease HI
MVKLKYETKYLVADKYITPGLLHIHVIKYTNDEMEYESVAKAVMSAEACRI